MMPSAASPALFVDLQPDSGSFLGDVLKGLAQSPKALSPKYFYDARGSQLFEAICELPEYYPTRTEMTLMRECAGEIASLLDQDGLLIEFGSGASVKTEILLQTMRPRAYVPVDISADALRGSVSRLNTAFPGLPVIAVCADYMQPMQVTELARYESCRRSIYFPGSTIGNLTPEEARSFLGRARGLAGAGGSMIVGVDLKKDPAVLHAAYNDAQGVTAEFNLNLLRRINHELAADFDLQQFCHIAFYNETAGRIEMHLESLKSQQVSVSGKNFTFDAGERMHTENSYKYTVEEFRALARDAGFVPGQVWVDAKSFFAVHLLRA